MKPLKYNRTGTFNEHSGIDWLAKVSSGENHNGYVYIYIYIYIVMYVYVRGGLCVVSPYDFYLSPSVLPLTLTAPPHTITALTLCTVATTALR